MDFSLRRNWLRLVIVAAIATMLLAMVRTLVQNSPQASTTSQHTGHLDDRARRRWPVEEREAAHEQQAGLRSSGTKAAPSDIKISSLQSMDGQMGKANKEISSQQDGYLVMDDHIVAHQRGERKSSLSAVNDTNYWSPKMQLQGGLIPSTIHYVWCGRRWFEFKHYLSVVSVIRAIHPDQIIFHYETEPIIDQEYYNQWLGELRKDYPYIKMDPMNDDAVKICVTDHETRVKMIMRMIDAGGGGMYVSENTWLLSFAPTRRLADMEFAIDPTSVDGYVLLRAGVISDAGDNWSDIIKNSSKYNAKVSSCGPINLIYSGVPQPHCYTVNGGRYKAIYPKDIWELDDPFGRLVRRLFYGSEEIRMPRPCIDELVPNIAHMVWLGGGRMDYVFYLSVLSVLYVAKVDRLYIHGDKPPAGDLWQKVVREQTRVTFVIRPIPDSVYGGFIAHYYRPLMSDIIRVELMIRYGGIYTDTDAIWVKPLTQEDRGYDAVATFDWIDWSYPFPDIVNFGVSYGKKDAPFWRIFRDSMRTLHNEHPGYTGVSMPYKLLEKYPHLLRIDRRLAVICYKFKCHPIYAENYHNESWNHMTVNSIPNWREDVNAFHWTHPNPLEYKDEATLRNSTGIFAEIGKNVLRLAGLL
ncbi:hypothetical protein NP493_108g01002 [Ridgeia piscesae]|uniref:Uncharacterized protein n=1 Tax=Ridgeia piscesae TaxID=27915 RepID=A0AAD9UH57_RIDPI|nr:hypothetical protein NP493_108g01002 [Ridgeia piscesae]